MADSSVPCFHDLSSVYDRHQDLSSRYEEISKAFEKRFGSLPDAITRAPGKKVIT